jgi:hypothetical protein
MTQQREQPQTEDLDLEPYPVWVRAIIWPVAIVLPWVAIIAAAWVW